MLLNSLFNIDDLKRQLAKVVYQYFHGTAFREVAEQNLISQWLFYVLTNDAIHRTCTHLRIESVIGQPAFGRVCYINGYVLLVQLLFEFEQELVDNAQDGCAVERTELYN